VSKSPFACCAMRVDNERVRMRGVEIDRVLPASILASIMIDPSVLKKIGSASLLPGQRYCDTRVRRMALHLAWHPAWSGGPVRTDGLMRCSSDSSKELPGRERLRATNCSEIWFLFVRPSSSPRCGFGGGWRQRPRRRPLIYASSPDRSCNSSVRTRV